MQTSAEVYPSPRTFKGMIAVESSKDGNRLQRTANLLIISPEEFAHMYLFAIENSILKGESDEILLR